MERQRNEESSCRSTARSFAIAQDDNIDFCHIISFSVVMDGPFDTL